MRANPSFFVAASLAVVILSGCQREESSDSSSSGSQIKAPAGAPTLELFVMSQCPYGVEVVNAATEARKQLGGGLAMDVEFIGDGSPGKLESMHGKPEVDGDLAQICAKDMAPDRYLDFISCQNKNPRAVDKNWRDCASEGGLEASAIESCMTGDKGQKLLAASFAEAKKRGASGSPTMFLNGKPYEGGRKPRDFMRSVCDAYTGDRPAACSKIPEPPRVKAIFLSDARCKECNIRALEPRLKSELGGLVVEHVDYATERGKAVYAELVAAEPGFKHLPTVLLGAEVEKDADGYGTLKQYMRPIGAYRELRVGGEWDPTAEICDNAGADDDGDGKGDCADDGCKSFLGCRPAIAKKLDLFIMSQCPYGAQAMIAAKEFVDHTGGEVVLDVHFIGEEANGELSSMHGPPEVEEDLRERCAVEHYGKQHHFLRYLACRSKDYKNPTWQPCAEEAGMDAAKIEACAAGEGKKLLAESFQFARSLKIGGSPTFLSNNKREFNAVAASEIQRQYCQDNPSLKSCADKIPPPVQAPGGAPGQQQQAQCN